jgi:hypothetical protein
MNRSDALFPSLLQSNKVNRALWFAMLAITGSIVIAISAKVKVPMWPVARFA